MSEVQEIRPKLDSGFWPEFFEKVTIDETTVLDQVTMEWDNEGCRANMTVDCPVDVVAELINKHLMP